MPRTTEQIAALQAEIAAIPSWYHAIDLGDGVSTPGPLELSSSLPHYPLPERMDGMRVIDVGASNGFYSYEFERRGAAEVVSIDLPSWLEHDWSPKKRREYDGYSDEERERFDQTTMRAGFELVGRELGSKVVRKAEMTIYEISPKKLGTFDLVFCGSVLMHIRDPVLALHGMRSVCRDSGSLVVSVSTIQDDTAEPMARFVGDWDQCNFWQFNPACLRRILKSCSFEPTGEEAFFTQTSIDGAFRDPLFICRAVPGA